jgi:hypothetical protein
VLRFVQNLGGVQQRLGRDTAAERADPAGIRLGVDDGHLHAEIGGVKGGGVASRSGTDHDETDTH